MKSDPPVLTKVPFNDLHAHYLSIKDEIDSAIADVIAQSAFVRGPFVEAFEKEFATQMEAKECVSCSDGTAALFIAMHAMGVGPGDEVITTAHSWISTSSMISQHGATPIFVDIDPRTYTINPALIEERITRRTVGIIPVHLYGQAADMDPILDIAARNGLWIIEDCAQAHLATYKGRQVGTFGHAGTWSFYPGKNLGAMGDAGAITTNDPELARRMARFARHGGLKKHDHEIEGINSRLDGLQAAILRVKLPHLRHWTNARRALAKEYDARLADIVQVPTIGEGREHVFHLYVIQHNERDALAAYLAEAGIQTVINYPLCLPFLPAYARFGATDVQFPVASAMQSRILSLPMFPEMSLQQLEKVTGTIESFSGESPKAARLPTTGARL